MTEKAKERKNVNVNIKQSKCMIRYTALQKFRNTLEKCGFGRYQHQSLSCFGANTLKELVIIIEDQQ